MIELHAEAPKIIVPLFARTLPELTAQAAAAQRADAADLVELRLDPLSRQDWPTALAQVRAAITKPLIVTIRTAREGGEVDLTPTEYGEACQALLAQGSADALDIEWLADKTLTEELRDAAHRAGVSTLFSEHHFGSTPDTGVMTDTLVGMLDLGADIAKLDGQWLVPVAYGTTTLTATCSGKTATATVTVVRIPEEIHLNIKEIRLKPGETVQLSAEFEPADADLYTALRWTTDTRGVATVDENGLVTAVGPGYTHIRAISTLSDYPEGYCDVTVENGE